MKQFIAGLALILAASPSFAGSAATCVVTTTAAGATSIDADVVRMSDTTYSEIREYNINRVSFNDGSADAFTVLNQEQLSNATRAKVATFTKVKTKAVSMSLNRSDDSETMYLYIGAKSLKNLLAGDESATFTGSNTSASADVTVGQTVVTVNVNCNKN